ncbi:hypothetical protein, partial [Kribbella albertanoniae]|uniref:hypothetical protein n=1 Tax=Kribbella albertanoniae TaxID=1266829 RepID=UPI001EDD38B5
PSGGHAPHRVGTPTKREVPTPEFRAGTPHPVGGAIKRRGYGGLLAGVQVGRVYCSHLLGTSDI